MYISSLQISTLYYIISLTYYSLSPVNICYNNTNVSAILFNSLHQGIMQKYKQQTV